MAIDGRPRILITRLSAIGDCILTLPLLCALRRAYPKSMLAWVTQPAAATLIEGHECLDELIVVPRRWLKSPPAVWQLRRRLRQLRFDVAIDAQSLFKSAMAGYLSGAKCRIGFAPPLGREWSHRLNNVAVQSQMAHVVDKHLELLEPLNIHVPAAEFRLPAYATETLGVSRMLPQLGLEAIPFAVLNPGGSWASKRWPIERFAQLARELGERCGLRSLVVWAGDDERRWASAIAATAPMATMAPPTTLRELAAILRRATLFVGGDTGPLHLAAAVGTTCVSLHGTTHARLSGPYGLQHIALQRYYQVGTSRQRRHADNDAMRAIDVPEVVVACRRVLNAQEKKRHAASVA